MTIVKPIPVNLPFEPNSVPNASPYLIAAAERAGIFDDAEARAARYDAQRQWLQLKVLPHGMDGWQFRLITGPGVNQDSYVCDQGFGFKSFEDAKAKGDKAKQLRARAIEREREAYIKFGGK